MANVYAINNGNWSNTAIWNTSALPTIVDDVFSNNFTIYVDNNYAVRSINNIPSTGINGGGRFILNNTVTLSANIVIGGGADKVACVQFLSAAPAFCTLVGSLCAVSTVTSGPRALVHNGTGTMNVYGNGLGRIKGIGNPADGYIQNQSTGTLNLFGSYLAGTQIIVDNRGIWNQTTGIINLVGSVSGGTGGEGIYNNSTGTVNVTGSVFGGAGGSGATVTGIAGVTTSGTINMLGDVFGRSGAGITNLGITNIIGNVFASPNVGSAHGFVHQGSFDTATIYGNVSGSTSSGSAYGVVNNSAGTTIIYGDVYAIAGSGARNTSQGNLIIYGNVYGGSAGSAHGVVNTSTATGTVLINGNVTGGIGAGSVGVVSNGNNTTIVNGNVLAGNANTAYGAANDAASYMEVRGFVIGNGFGIGSTGISSTPAIQGSPFSTTVVRNLSCGSRGQWPTTGVIKIQPLSNSTATFETSAFQDVTLFTSFSANIVPPLSSVRLGTRYNLNDYVGTCAMPSISSVLQNISVGNSVGIAALQPQTIWGYSTLSATNVNSLGGRLKDIATIQTVGQQLTALKL